MKVYMSFLIPIQKNLIDGHLEVIAPKFKQISDYLEGKSFLMGEKVTVADFPMYIAIKWHQEIVTELNLERKVCYKI